MHFVTTLVLAFDGRWANREDDDVDDEDDDYDVGDGDDDDDDYDDDHKALAMTINMIENAILISGLSKLLISVWKV